MHPVLITIIKRLLLGLFTLFLVSLIIFSSISFLPGDFAQAVLGQAALEDTVAAFRRELGLDEPIFLRYFDWIGGVMTGDFGVSFSGRASSGIDRSRAVIDLIGPRLYNTVFLATMAAIVAVPLSLFLGVTTALFRNSLYDRVVSTTTLTAISIPEFFMAYILVLLFSTFNKFFPSISNVSADMDLAERIYRTTLPALTLTLFSHSPWIG